GKALDKVVLHSVKAGARENVAKERRVLRGLIAAVDEKDQLDSRIIVDCAADLIGKHDKRIIRAVIHGCIQEYGPRSLEVTGSQFISLGFEEDAPTAFPGCKFFRPITRARIAEAQR